MGPLVVCYFDAPSGFSPAFDVGIITKPDKEVCKKIARGIESGEINKVVIAGPAATAGFRIVTNREVTFIYRKGASPLIGKLEENAANRIVNKRAAQ